jgi:hypothetical protein
MISKYRYADDGDLFRCAVVTSKKFSINLANHARRCSPPLQTGSRPTTELTWGETSRTQVYMKEETSIKSDCFALTPNDLFCRLFIEIRHRA